MAITPTIVEFDYEEFISLYPDLSTFTEAQLNNFFNIATGILTNRVGVVVCNYAKLKTMLYLLTAHIAFLSKQGAGVVGIMSSATEGSVSVGYALPSGIGKPYFWQTQYGQLFWQMVSSYLTGRYIC